MSDTPDPRPLSATYRLQLHAGFTFADAARVVPYLADLGVSHVYLSPVLTAVPGSQHGYDVVDHSRVSAELGGRAGLVELSSVCRAHGLGIVVDIVPNHMALVAPLWHNAPVWEMLRDGQTAARAHWFDVDWDALDGRIGLPVLGDTLNRVLAGGALSLDTGRGDEGPAAGQPVIRYYDHVWPVAPGTWREGDDVATVVQRQHYLLACWREGGEFLNYRRFFEVDGLIGVRVEEPDVFEATHRTILDLHHAGVIDGLRIDHPDGLADPAAYLDTLADHLRPGTPVWVEKILERGETLPTDWACAGTTGYDANAVLTIALIDPASAEEVGRSWAWAGGTPWVDDVAELAKREAVEELLVPEVSRLLRLATRVLPDTDEDELRVALTELLVAVDVYRAYLRPGEVPAQDSRQRLHEAIERAVEAAPDTAETITSLGRILGDPDAGSTDPAAAYDLAVRFQQTTGPVMAKGIEDTALYRWHRMVALNEVGGHPSQGSTPSAEPLAAWARHQAEHWPRGMTTLSTHDTKRSEDVRARVLAVSGDAVAWDRATRAAVAEAIEHGVDAPTGHLVMQTVVGAGEIGSERLDAYLTKALREAKWHTTWTEPETDYEDRVKQIGEQAQHSGELHAAIKEAVAGSERAIRAVVLGQKLLQLTLPGVPDTYQGTELVDLSLVDPDNRRPVDYAARRSALSRLDDGQAPRDLSEEKLLITTRVLRLRLRLPEALGPDASYESLEAGPHLLGHLRGGRVAALAVRAPHSLEVNEVDEVDGFGEHRVDLPPGSWVDELTGRRVQVEESGLLLAEAFADAPVALLVREEAGR
ncbi:MAG: malto-oligosyltrehalose synthase [Actinobacteria bacterium]|nr:malto-oligosyltrehalose synthase [Actinomycetota bacterium]